MAPIRSSVALGPRRAGPRRVRPSAVAIGVAVVVSLSSGCGSSDDISESVDSDDEEPVTSPSELDDASGNSDAPGEPSRSTAVPIEIDYLGLDIVITDLWTEWVTDPSDVADHRSFDPGDDEGIWIARATVEGRAQAPVPGEDRDWTYGPFDFSTLAIIDEQGRLFRLEPPDVTDHSMGTDEFRSFTYTAQLAEAVDLTTVDLAIFYSDEDHVTANRTLVPLDGTWAQGPSEIDLAVGDIVSVHADGFADDGQMTVLGAQIGRTAGLYRQGGYSSGSVGEYRASLGAFDTPHGFLWFSVQLQYDKIDPPGIDPGTYLPDLQILADGVFVPSGHDFPLVARGEVGALDEYSMLIPESTTVVTFVDGDEAIGTVELPEIPSEWRTRFAPATEFDGSTTRLYSGDSLCADIDLDEIEAATGATWASTGVSPDPWTRQSADERRWEVQCGVSVTIGDEGAYVLISARGCGLDPCEEQAVAPVGRRFDGFIVDVTADDYNRVEVGDGALQQLLELAMARLEG